MSRAHDRVAGPDGVGSARQSIRVNGAVRSLSPPDADMKLLRWLREREFLTGTKNGCEIGVCGTCTVLVDGTPVRACKTAVKDVSGEVVTIEGMERPDGSLHPLQQAFVDLGAIQCGFCTPGMVLAAQALLTSNLEPSRKEIRRALQGNLCRCTGYQQIVDAVEHAARYMRDNGGIEPPGCTQRNA